jgi:DNA invertase Pin-like site-specific DNA recombinase
MVRRRIKENPDNPVALLRLSKEDLRGGRINESLSIENQRKTISEFCERKGWKIGNFYVDDGISGTVFDEKREGFTRLMTDVRDGVADCVIITDLSRLGRIASKTGGIRKELQHSGVRYIAIADFFDNLYDAERKGMNADVQFREMANEFHPAITSQKVRAVKKMHAHNGYFANSRPAYGFLKESDVVKGGDKHKLVVNDEVRQNAVRIFESYIGGTSARGIADMFNREGILSPQAYYYKRIGEDNPNEGQSNLWTAGSVTTILKNHAYYGAIVNCRREVRDYDDHTVDSLPEDEWIIVEDMHEPIVSKEVWQQARDIMARNKKNVRKPLKDSTEHDILSGVLKCGGCGGNMMRKVRRNKTCPDTVLYRCSNWVQKSKCACTSHEIKFDVISQAVLADIREYAALAAEDERELIERIRDSDAVCNADSLKQLEKTLRECNERMKVIDKTIRSLYEDKVLGNITAERFRQMTAEYEKEYADLTAQARKLERECESRKRSERDMSAWIARIKDCLTIDALTRHVVVGLVDSIEISEAVIDEGGKTFDITIHYKFRATKRKD